MKAIVLAAGEGKRMRPLTANRPKVLLPILGESLVSRLCRQLVQCRVTDITVVVHYHAESVRAALGDGTRLGAKIRYAEQGEPKGTGHAAAVGARTAGVANEPFLVVNGDLLLDDADVARFVEAARRGGVLTGASVADARAYGVLELVDGKPVRIVEKSPNPPSKLANAGLYGFPAGFATRLEQLPRSPRGEFEITDAINAGLAAGVAFDVVDVPRWLDVGRPWDLLAATERALSAFAPRIDGKVEAGATLHGAVHVGEGTIVKAGVYIEGPVYIGKNASIGPNCYIRPFTAIGNGCKVGNGCEVKASVLMDGAHVGHLSYVGDSVLGERVNFGAGTKVANLRHDGKTVKVRTSGETVDTFRRKLGVIVGDDVHTGINTSLNVGVVLSSGASTKPGETVMFSID